MTAPRLIDDAVLVRFNLTAFAQLGHGTVMRLDASELTLVKQRCAQLLPSGRAIHDTSVIELSPRVAPPGVGIAD